MTAPSKETRPSSPGVTIRWLMEDAITEDAGLSLARMTVDPDFTSEAHRHPNCTETIHVLSGRVEQRRGDDWIEMGDGDTILIREGEIHQTRNIGTETADLMLAYSSGSRLYET